MRRLLMLLFVFIASAQLFAQTAEKTIPFTVVMKKVTIPGADVTVMNTATRTEWKTQTNRSGQYSTPFLPAGSYEITVQSAGFAPHHQTGIVLEVGAVTRLDVALQVGGVSETVKVNSVAPPVATATASVRSRTSSFCRMFLTWTLTVSSVRPMRAAICAFVRPVAMRQITSVSRGGGKPRHPHRACRVVVEWYKVGSLVKFFASSPRRIIPGC